MVAGRGYLQSPLNMFLTFDLLEICFGFESRQLLRNSLLIGINGTVAG